MNGYLNAIFIGRLEVFQRLLQGFVQTSEGFQFEQNSQLILTYFNLLFEEQKKKASTVVKVA